MSCLKHCNCGKDDFCNARLHIAWFQDYTVLQRFIDDDENMKQLVSTVCTPWRAFVSFSVFSHVLYIDHTASNIQWNLCGSTSGSVIAMMRGPKSIEFLSFYRASLLLFMQCEEMLLSTNSFTWSQDMIKYVNLHQLQCICGNSHSTDIHQVTVSIATLRHIAFSKANISGVAL